MQKVRIVGVPEHFNLPWLLAIEEGAFKNRGIDLEWNDIPEGTGRMCELLHSGETDLAIVLTEGAVKSISGGNRAKIVQEYISSPLLWGIHVRHSASYQRVAELENVPTAISRMGSGSHLMTHINAQNQGWDTQKLQFEIVNTLNGAIENFRNGSDAYFLWEHFTTKPLVDKGFLRRLGDCPTPWPCFVIVATDHFATKYSTLLTHIVDTINIHTSEFNKIPSIDRTLSNRYDQKLEDIQDWFSKTSWSQKQLEKEMVNKVQKRLYNLQLVKELKEPAHFLYSAD